MDSMLYTTNLDDTLYGQATDDGYYDDVETYDGQGQPSSGTSANSVQLLAWGMVVLSLAALWVMGAAIFKGSNQS